jgi:hypothetical protein
LSEEVDSSEAPVEKVRTYAERLALDELAYFGPFEVNDVVSINGSHPVRVEEITADGVRATRTAPVPGQVHWFPKIGMSSVVGTPNRMTGLPEKVSHVDHRVVEDAVEGDESLPMRPPPVQPGAEATFR